MFRFGDTTGFPDLQWQEDDLPTRPMPLHERPMQARIDHELAIIARVHVRIAQTIEESWGHPECAKYMQELIMNGAHQNGDLRTGFKPEVLAALINLSAFHRL